MVDPVIIHAVRTPIGSFNGGLASLSATRLGGIVIEEIVRRANIEGTEVDEVIMGNILSAGLGQAPARQATLYSGLPHSVGALTINKVCGSGLKSVILAAQAIKAEDAKVVVAGGMESMSNAPYLLTRARTGYRMGHGELIDSMIKDGLWDVYNNFHMGSAAELCAKRFNISREEQDQYAISSYQRANLSREIGAFKTETLSLTLNQKGKEMVISDDEPPKTFHLEKLKTLRPAFEENGSVTAGNASPLGDGAAALLVMESRVAAKKGLTPLARIVGYTVSAIAPEWYTIAPANAIEKLLKKSGYRISDIDLFEINEAFSASSIAVNRILGLDPEKVNARGGSVALGHPIGASGSRILTTLIYALKEMGKKRGIASLCLGGGEAVAMMIEI